MTGGESEVVALTDATYHDLVNARPDPILVAFVSEAGSTSSALRPVLTDLARERSGRLIVASVDIIANPAIAQAWGITQVPVMLLFHRGVLQRVFRGVRPYARLIMEIDEMIPDTSPPTTSYPALLGRVDKP